MNKREELEGEVRRIVSPKARPIVIECPDGTELKLHVRAISFQSLESSTEVISNIIHGSIYGAFKAKEMSKAMDGAEDFDAANVFTTETVGKLKDKLLSFLPWFIEVGTDIKWKDISDLDYLVTLELLLEIITFNFGERLRDFFSRGLERIGPLILDGKAKGLAAGLSSSPSLSTEDMTTESSGSGASEN